MALKIFVFQLILLFATFSAAFATEVGSEKAGDEINSILEKNKIMLTDLFRLADLTSPTLAAARNGVQAKAGLARQVGLYPNPSIELEIGELSTRDPNDRKEKVSLVQPLILSGRRGAAVAAARAEQEAEVHRYYGVRTDVFRRIHTLWAEQLYFREASAAFGELLQVANLTLEVAESRFESRAAPESQVTKALLEVYELEVGRQQLAQEQTKGLATLSSLLGGAPIPSYQLGGALDSDSISISELLGSNTLDEHPALQAAQRDIDTADALLQEAKASKIPDLGLFIAYGRYRAVEEGFVEAGITMPLPIFNRNQGRVAETQSLIAQAQDRERIVHNDLKTKLEVASQRYLTSRDQLNVAVSRIMPAAERGLTQAQEGYRVGHLPFLELIDAQRTLANIRLRILKLKKDLIVTEAELMSLVHAGPYGEIGDKP
ncbi:MAG: TolC family protein [Gammaproteobacteria bacterium]|nr:TolC family protein [Gammaproteobacteria bacterium]